MSERVEIQWGIDWGDSVSPAIDEGMARRCVKSYEDRPDVLGEGDPMPVLVCRTVTTTDWTTPAPRLDGEHHQGEGL